MKRGILIVGDENSPGMKLLERQLSEQLTRRSCPMGEEFFRPFGTETRAFVFRQKGHERTLSADWIAYLEKDMRRIFIHLENGVKISFYGSMEEAINQLGRTFCHCHKSYVVNMDKVADIGETMFYMKDGSEIPIGQRRYAEVRRRYEVYRDQKNLENLRFFESFSCFEM